MAKLTEVFHFVKGSYRDGRSTELGRVGHVGHGVWSEVRLYLGCTSLVKVAKMQCPGGLREQGARALLNVSAAARAWSPNGVSSDASFCLLGCALESLCTGTRKVQNIPISNEVQIDHHEIEHIQTMSEAVGCPKQ